MLRPEPDPADAVRSQPRDPAELRFELSLGVLGAVCGGLLTVALAALDASTTGQVVGLVFGSALPPFVAAVGRRRRLRATVGVMLTGASVVLAYGGTNAFAVAIGKPPVLPALVQFNPPAAVAPSDPPETEAPEKSTTAAPTSSPPARAPAPDISVAPEQVGCETGGCDEVIVASTGTAPLRVTKIEFLGAAKQNLAASGCTDVTLDTDEQCTIRITFDSADHSDPLSATLVIHQNLPGPPTFVPVAVRSGQRPC